MALVATYSFETGEALRFFKMSDTSSTAQGGPVAEVSKIGSLEDRWVAVNHGWVSDSTDV